MKKLFFALSLLIGPAAFAGESYVCKEIGRGNHVLKLTQVGDDDIQEGAKYPFYLELYRGKKFMHSQYVTVTTEDVMFEFQGHKLTGMIYLDELDQTHLTLNAKEYRFDCGTEE